MLGYTDNINRTTTLKKLKSEALDLRAREDWSEKAVESNTRILKVDLCNKAALNRRARCYLELGDFSAAGRDYRRALELDPENTNIQDSLKTIEDEARKQRADEESVEKIRTTKSFDKAYAIARSHKSKSSSKRLIAVEASNRLSESTRHVSTC